MSDEKLTAAIRFVPSGRPPTHMNALALAYIGDAVYELFVRQELLRATNHKPQHLHRQAIRFVSANAQSQALQLIWSLLTDEEQDIVKRGRNANSGTVPKNVEPQVYRRATGFESLLGYLYLLQRFDRLNELVQVIVTEYHSSK
jgi:ribonuclease-3 family protein